MSFDRGGRLGESGGAHALKGAVEQEGYYGLGGGLGSSAYRCDGNDGDGAGLWRGEVDGGLSGGGTGWAACIDGSRGSGAVA